MKKGVARRALVAAKVYVSDASEAYTKSLAPVLRKRSAVAAKTTTAGASTPSAALIDIFTDVPYSRTNLTVVGSVDAVAELSLDLTLRALRGDAIKLSAHRGTHPRVGVVDHVAFHPLDPARDDGMSDAMRAAEVFAERLRAERLVPVFVYGGEGHPSLVDVRKQQTDFFKDPVGGIYEGLGGGGGGAVGGSNGDSDGGGGEGGDGGSGSGGGDGSGGARNDCNNLDNDLGVTIVGACPWVTNYNLLLETTDLRAGRKVARRVRAWEGFEKGTVQTMALAHDGGRIEIACNVLDAAGTGLGAVQDAIAKSAELELGDGFPAAQCPMGYVVGGLKEEDVLAMAKEMVEQVD